MTELTPGFIIAELASLRAEASKGIALLAEVEAKAVRLDLEADKVESLAFMEAQGTVADRQHIARIKAIDAREAAGIAKVEVNRVKIKLKHLSEAQMAIQTSARMVELEWKTGGIGGS